MRRGSKSVAEAEKREIGKKREFTRDDLPPGRFHRNDRRHPPPRPDDGADDGSTEWLRRRKGRRTWRIKQTYHAMWPNENKQCHRPPLRPPTPCALSPSRPHSGE